jgi:hypothetical protein
VLGSRLIRCAVLGACLSVAGLVLAVHPTWAATLGIDVWNVPALKAQMRTSAEEGHRLDAEDEYVRRRIELKEMIVRDLIAEKIPLAEATDRFAALNAMCPRSEAAVRDFFPGSTDREKTARNVISFAVTRAAPHAQAALASRLESELRQMLVAAPRG